MADDPVPPKEAMSPPARTTKLGGTTSLPAPAPPPRPPVRPIGHGTPLPKREPELQTAMGMAATMPHQMLRRLDTGTRVRQYELIRELGRGGMGRVFLARDIKLARRVAIK